MTNNTLGWKWVAGCGANDAPEFRIFNPVILGEKFDPTGDDVRKWIPEFSMLTNRGTANLGRQIGSQFQIVKGKTYPNPTIDHAKARKIALDAYALVKK